MALLDKAKGLTTKGLFVVLSGSAVASVISFLSTPVLSRLATPEAFAYLGVLMALFNPISVSIALRLDTAIPLPKEQSEAKTLVWLSWISAAALSLIATLAGLLILWFSPDSLPALYPPVLQIFPVLLLACGVVMPLQYWLQRQQAYRSISVSRIVQMSLIAITSVILAALDWSLSLVIGYILGWCSYAVVLYRLALKAGFSPHFPGWKTLKVSFLQYRHFAGMYALGSFLSVLAVSVPVFVFSRDFSEAETGYLNLVRHILFMASSFVASSFIQTYYSRYSQLRHEGRALMPLTLKVARLIAIPALLMLLLGVFLGEPLFVWVFGEDWSRSGELAAWMAPVIALQMLSAPLSPVLLVLNRVRLFSLWQIAYFSLIAALMFFQFSTPAAFLKTYLLLEALCYGAQLWLVFYTVRRSDKLLMAS
jgi:O-antigen/teichoic acid export membrane protein